MSQFFGRQQKPEFCDAYAAEYDAVASSRNSHFGREQKLLCQGSSGLAGSLSRPLAEAPHVAMDFGCGTGSATPFLLNELAQRGFTPGWWTHPFNHWRLPGRRMVNVPGLFLLQNIRPPKVLFDLVFCNGGSFHHIPPGGHVAASRRAIFFSVSRRRLGHSGKTTRRTPGTRYIMRRILFDHNAITLSA